MSVPRNDLFLRACHRESVSHTPVWLMRQAGRYLPEYREIRKDHQILDMIKDPDLSTEVTMQPLRRFELDAGIIFADILTLPEAMGLDLEFISGHGPRINNPISEPGDVDRLHAVDPEEGLGFTLQAIRQTLIELDGRIPLIGFSGAPFTLACYAIEGGGSKEFLRSKVFMYEHPSAWYALMEKLADSVAAYLVAQARAGAHALQLFDSWAGILGPGDYREFVLPFSRSVIEQVKDHTDVPVIHFGTGTTGILPMIREAGGDVIGADWRVRIMDAWENLGDQVAIQGNLDPTKLLGPEGPMLAEIRAILNAVGTRPGHIFNLGHGINKNTNPERVARLVDFVHGYSAKLREEATTAG